MNLKGQMAVITGGARGIGRATALRFAREGAHVAIIDKNREAGEALVGEIIERVTAPENGWRTPLFVLGDVTRHDEAHATIETIHRRFRRIDVLINNAGIVIDAQLPRISEEQFDAVLSVNLKGTFNCTQAVAPIMIAQGSGRIINVSSVVGLYGNFGQTSYAASKAGIIGMTKVWARELGRKGICVNAVAPGFISTDMISSVPGRVLTELNGKIPLGRFGRPEEVAGVYVFLASRDAAYINGAVLSVDGGITL
ncbi:MAG TPA: beta-ketoacyl-ACP reductase [Candidatus Methylomirabilis sp.]|nr:beta-ketoacyl-ACP reductase [Candidatus Methylomirabilis sp.]